MAELCLICLTEYTKGEFGIEVDYDNPAFPTSFCLFLCLVNQLFSASVCIFPEQIIK